jgi:hypothetical protein
MSQYKTNACITIFPFGDVAVDVEVTIDLATETVAIEDVTVQGAHLEWKCIFFAGGVPFADFVAETLILQSIFNRLTKRYRLRRARKIYWL